MKKLLVVQHAPHEHPGVVGELLKQSGMEFNLVRPFAGEALPEPERVSGMISLGGPMSSNDESTHPWIRPELELIRAIIAGERPFLGICLGAQLACRALGGKVTRLPLPEIGWHGVQLTAEGVRDSLLGRLSPEMRVYQWHYESFDIPAEGIHLLESANCSHQAWRIGTHAYGVQFHPEVDARLLEEWLSAEGSEAELSEARLEFGPQAVQSPAEQRSQARQAAASNRRMAEALVRIFYP